VHITVKAAALSGNRVIMSVVTECHEQFSKPQVACWFLEDEATPVKEECALELFPQGVVLLGIERIQ
jgi:hypothetical protein